MHILHLVPSVRATAIDRKVSTVALFPLKQSGSSLSSKSGATRPLMPLKMVRRPQHVSPFMGMVKLEPFAFIRFERGGALPL